MLTALSRIFGFDRPPPPVPTKRRRTPAPVVPPRAQSNGATAPVPAPHQKALGQPRTTAEAVAAMAKVHASSNAWRSYTSGPPEVLDAKARLVLGDELHSYCRALTMTGGKLPNTIQSREWDPDYNKVILGNLELDCSSDVDTWEKAMNAYATLAKTYRRAALPVPAPLTIPEAILKAIATRQAERAERLAQREGRAGGGKGGVTRPTTPAEDSGGGEASKLKGSRKKRDDDDGGSEFPAPPAGPRR